MSFAKQSSAAAESTKSKIISISKTELPAPPSELLDGMETEIARLMHTLRDLRRKVRHDDLTGLLRRDEFFYRLEQLLREGQGGNFSILMIDIDNFKKLNDENGHQAGDVALQRVASVIGRCGKTGAATGRYGGEEFIVAICGSEKLAMALGEALRRQIAKEVGVTVSVGTASAQQAEFEASRMVSMADEALYRAKVSGKNKVCSAA